MFIYNNTSTLHHPPIVTITLILTNVVVFAFSASADPTTVSEYCLWYGNGYHPVQWVTSAFLHIDAVHLIGNMMFLWPFGLLVEGKMGWWRFLVLYLVIALGQNVMEQTIMLGAESTVNSTALMDAFAGDSEFQDLSPEEREFFVLMIQSELGDQVRRSLGASAVIFGLLSVCILFAPASDFNVWWRFWSFELPVLVVGGLYVLLELFQWRQGNFGISSAALHLMGMVTGAIVGYAALRMNAAQCDGEDFFNHFFSRSASQAKSPKKTKVTKSRHVDSKKSTTKQSKLDAAKAKFESKKQARAAARAASQKEATTEVAQPIVKRIEELIEQSDFVNATKQLLATTDLGQLQRIPSSQYRRLYQQLASQKQLKAVAIVLQKWIQAHPTNAGLRKLRLASILLGMDRNSSALKVLSSIKRESLDQKNHAVFKELVTKARSYRQ